MSVKHPNIKFQLNGIAAIPFMSMLLANERANVRALNEREKKCLGKYYCKP